MGGRGASSMSGGRGSVAKGSLILPSGETIEFDGDLQYGVNDKTLTGAARATIENWENKRYKNKIEFGTVVDEYGNALGERKGSKGSVRTPISWRQNENNVFSHNHPRESGGLGGSFSEGDLMNFANLKARTSRATAKEGTYSISKGKNFNASAFKEYVLKTHADLDNKYSLKFKKFNGDYRDKKISYSEYLKAYNKTMNSQLIDMHNAYIAGQKQYGYTYTLEKRK